MEYKELALLNRIWGPGKDFDEEALETLAGQILEQGAQRGFVSLLPIASNRLRAASVRQHHEEEWAADFGFSEAYITFLDSIIAAFIYDPDAIAVPSNIPIRMFRWYRNVEAFNKAMTPDLLKAPLPRPEFWQRGFSKIAREIFTDRVVAYQVQASLDAFIGTFLAQPKMQTLYSNSESVVRELASYLPDNWSPDGYFDFTDTKRLVGLLDITRTIDVTQRDVEHAITAAAAVAVAVPYLTRIQIADRIKDRTSPQNMKHILNNGIRSNADVLMRHIFQTADDTAES